MIEIKKFLFENKELMKTAHNIRYEVSNVNTKRGTFTLMIRRGDDTHKRKQIMESYTNVSLDPNSTNFLGGK